MSELKKFKAETFDIMQYFFRSVHDPLIRCCINFSGHLDEDVLKKAVTISAGAIPLIQCCFDVTEKHPCWRNKGFTSEDIVHVVKAEQNVEEQKISILSSTIDIANEPQLKIYILREKEVDTLFIIINHMVCDGAGFKEYLYLLSDLYSKCKNNENNITNMSVASRSTGQLFDNFNLTEKLNILFSKYDLSKQKKQATYCLQGDKSNPIFATLKITREEFTYIKTYAKNKGVTINDLILTAYVWVLHRETGNRRIVIPCPVDLRKYLRPNGKHGICNLTSNFICDIIMDKNESFEDTLIQVSNQMKLQKASRNCLKSVMMLEFAFRLLPFSIMQKVFNKIFKIPIISFTNLGIIDKNLLSFRDIKITNVYLTGAVKYVPYFQIATSSYDNECTLSCNLYGTQEDKLKIEHFLMDMKKLY